MKQMEGFTFFHVFLYLVLSKLVLQMYHDCFYFSGFQIELCPSLLYFYDVRGTVEED